MASQHSDSPYFFNTYKRLPLEIERGEGVYLYTRDGKRYLDFFAGIGVNALGHCHPAVVDAIIDQSRRYIHLSNSFRQEPQERLAEMLVRSSGFPKVFFSNSGTEAIEGAIKIARKWGAPQQKKEILSFSNAFHGRTMGALSLMDRAKYRNGYEPFLPNFRTVEFNNTTDLRRAVSAETVAVVLEFIQGEGGIRPISREMAQELVDLRETFGFLIIADEIQSGIGRTGKLFGFEHFNVEPDIVVLAKPVGGGLPLGAILGGERVQDVLEVGVHGSTFGGNPIACAAGAALLCEVLERGVMRQAEVMGETLQAKLHQLQREFPALIKEVRGFGLMVGVELTKDAEPVSAALRNEGVLINVTGQTVLRLLPPLIIQREHIDEVIEKLRRVLGNF